MADGMRIVMLAGEAVPFAKVGGLADVLGALPLELEKLGCSVSLIIPRYPRINLDKFGFQRLAEFDTRPFDVHRASVPDSQVEVFLVGNDQYFGRGGIYTDPATGLDYPDQADRWIFFQQSAMELIRSFPSPVDVLHCHDHQTGLIPAYLQRQYKDVPVFRHAGSVFTIHNMGYQGVFPGDTMARTGLDPAEFYPMSSFEFYGMLNFMKVGVVFSDVVTTVSETYAREIQLSEDFGYGLEGVVRERAEPPIGILNGIDERTWNPATDAFLKETYSADRLEGKRANKAAVLQEFALDPSRMDRPLLAMISRIDVQKGFDLIVAVLDELLSRDVSFVLLGSGNKDTEGHLLNIVSSHSGRAGLRFAYDERLAHLIEAGADMFLMPSKYEPCGLNQMYSMRYGTVPIVRATGGLADTVKEFDPETGSGAGFRFGPYDALHFKEAVGRALRFWEDPGQWRRIMLNGMRTDFSWARSARRYAEVYENVRKRHPR